MLACDIFDAFGDDKLTNTKKYSCSVYLAKIHFLRPDMIKKVILGCNTIRYIRGKILDSLIMTHATLLWKRMGVGGGGGDEVERTGMTEMRTAEVLAVREA